MQTTVPPVLPSKTQTTKAKPSAAKPQCAKSDDMEELSTHDLLTDASVAHDQEVLTAAVSQSAENTCFLRQSPLAFSVETLVRNKRIHCGNGDARSSPNVQTIRASGTSQETRPSRPTLSLIPPTQCTNMTATPATSSPLAVSNLEMCPRCVSQELVSVGFGWFPNRT